MTLIWLGVLNEELRRSLSAVDQPKLGKEKSILHGYLTQQLTFYIIWAIESI